MQWEVKWKGWDSKHNTYEPIGHLAGCEDMIAEYQERKRQRDAELEAEERERKRKKQEEAEAERKRRADAEAEAEAEAEERERKRKKQEKRKKQGPRADRACMWRAEAAPRKVNLLAPGMRGG